MRNMVGGGMLFYHMIRSKNKKRKTNKRRVKRLLRQTFQDRVTSLVSCSHIQKQLYYKFFATTSVTCTFDFGKIFTTTSFFSLLLSSDNTMHYASQCKSASSHFPTPSTCYIIFFKKQ